MRINNRLESLKRKIFKTRHEVEYLRKDVEVLTGMLKVHFDIKYTFNDYTDYIQRHPDTDIIPVTGREWLHYGDMLSRTGSSPTQYVPNQEFKFRDIPVLPVRKYTK